MTDRRLRAANAHVAAIALQGQVTAPRYVKGVAQQVIVPVADLCAAANGPRDRQLLLGEQVCVFDTQDGWSFVQVDKDGYVGYLNADQLGAVQTSSHWINAAATHLYLRADFKVKEAARLSLGATVAVTTTVDRFSQTPFGWIPTAHLSPVSSRPADPVAVAEHLLGTPYLWGGNSRDGIDCSGLVQLACWICGFDCPADSDLQAASLGVEMDSDAQVRRGDLLFWHGHVAFAVDRDTLLHANSGHMATVYEPLEIAVDRIAAQGDGEITLRRRLSQSKNSSINHTITTEKTDE